MLDFTVITYRRMVLFSKQIQAFFSWGISSKEIRTFIPNGDIYPNKVFDKNSKLTAEICLEAYPDAIYSLSAVLFDEKGRRMKIGIDENPDAQEVKQLLNLTPFCDTLNEFALFPTDAFRKHMKSLKALNIQVLIEASESLQSLLDTVEESDENEEMIDDARMTLENLDLSLETFSTDLDCPNDCGSRLYLSDLPQYDYVCYKCDENF
jgi:hypothetical protein